MAKEFYDWVKLALDNKWLVMLCFTGLGSVATNITQLVYSQEKDIEIKQTQEQIAMIADHYQTTTTPKIVVQKSSCGNCNILLNSHIKEFH